MLLKLKHRMADGLLLAADVIGIALAGSGALVLAFLGRFMLAVVLGAIALGFVLRLAGRRRAQGSAPRPMPSWGRGLAGVLAAIEVAVLVEATNFPVRFDQAGFEPWHWALVLVALAVIYPFNLRLLGGLVRRTHVTNQP